MVYLVYFLNTTANLYLGSCTMTNSAPEPPENIQSAEERERRRVALTFDEMVAIIVAFATIGAILLWSFTNKKEGVLNGQWQNNLFSLGNTETTGNSADNNGNLKLDTGGRNRDNLELEANNGAIATPGNFDSRQEASVQPARTSRKLATVPKPLQPENRSRLLPTPVPVPLPSDSQGGNQTEAIRPTSPDGTNDRPAVTPNAPTPETQAGEVNKTPEVIPVPVNPNQPEATTPESTAKQTPVFQDVPESYWAYPFVVKLQEKQLITGTSADKFEPDKLITRAEMATLISQAFALPNTQSKKNFKDVSANNALTADINKALEMGFMKGYSNNEFRPLENIPRYQVLVALATGLNLPQTGDSDAILQKFGDSSDLPQWAKSQIAAATQANLVVNRPNLSKDNLNPNESATRGEVAVSIYQALVESGKLDPIDSQYIVKP
jgi:hypothetical protein